jgi:integrase
VHLNPEGRTQTAKHRATVPMTGRVEAALKAAWEARTTDHVIEHGGAPVASIKKAFSAASQKAALHVTPYTLRHSAAVWMAESGVPMEEIAAYLGHSDARTTFRHYARFSPDYLRKAATALDW